MSHKFTWLAAALLSAGAITAAHAAPQGLVPIAAPKAVSINVAPGAALQGNHEMLVRAAPGASFVKLHFDAFKLPKGAVLEVSDASGQEVYRYSADQLGPHTVEASLGEDGKTRFAAMSVSGDVAKVRLVLNGATWNWREHAVHVHQVMEGFTHEQIQEVIHQAEFSACGVDERKDVACYASSNKAEYDRSRPVARLVMGGGLCTAWRVGSDNRMMTNNHCISDQAGTAASEVWFNYQNTTCGGSTLAAVTKVAAKTMLKTDATLDYTLFTLADLAPVASFGNFGLDVRVPVKDEQIFIPQHGQGKPKQLAIISDKNTGNVCRIDTATQNGNGTGTDTGYMCDTQPGSSGSPVLASSSKKVVALHHFGGCANAGVQIVKIWPQISSFFNNVIPEGDGGSTGGGGTPSADFTFSAKDLVVTFADKSTDTGGTIGSYAWNFGDNTTATTASPSHTYAKAGTYSVSLMVTDSVSKKTSTKTQSVTVTAASTGPVANFSFTQLKAPARTIKFIDTSTTSGGATIATRAWNFGDGKKASTPKPNHTYAKAGTYTVSETVTDSNGKSATKSQSVVVK